MKMFQNMTLSQAKTFYAKILAEKQKLDLVKQDSTILKMALDDIYKYTNGLTKNY